MLGAVCAGFAQHLGTIINSPSLAKAFSDEPLLTMPWSLAGVIYLA